MANNNIDRLIPTRKQSQKRIERLNPNPFHKDHLGYDFEKDAFLCPNNKYLYFYKEYVEHNGDSINQIKLKGFTIMIQLVKTGNVDPNVFLVHKLIKQSLNMVHQ